MKAIVFQEEKNFDSLQIKDMPDPRPRTGEVVVQIKAAALNHRDVWITRGLYPGIKVPVILGSDGAGVVHQVGKEVDSRWLGKAVIINPALGWGDNPGAQRDDFRILGMPDHGTQAQYVAVPAENLAEKPSHLSFAEAAALPLGGLTGYRALFTRGKLTAGETVLLTGIGGGVAALMLLMAKAARATVLVTSGSEAKIRRATELGAAGGANYQDEGWPGEIAGLAKNGGVDLAVDSAGGRGFERLITLVRPGGRIVTFGATTGNPPEFNLRKVFWRQLTIQGSTMGSPADFSEMVRFFERHQLRPVVDGPYPFSDYRQAYQRMLNSEQFGKIVITGP